MFVSAERVRWSRVEERLKTFPREASDLDASGRFLLNAVLARDMDDYPSARVVEAFIQAFPPSIWSSANIGGIPLEVAAWRRAPLDILKVLMDSRPSMPHDYTALNILWNTHNNVFERNNMSLVEVICEGGREGTAIWTKLYMLLRYCTDPRKNISTWRGLHLASVSPTCSPDLFKLIMQLNSRGEAKRPNEKGQLPLHCLASCADQLAWREKLDMLLEAHPDAVRAPDANGLLPLHTAVLCGRSAEFIDKLIAAAPDTLARRGGNGSLFPFQLAASSSQASVSLTYHLLRAAPHLLNESSVESSEPHDEEITETSMPNIVTISSDQDNNQSFIDLVDIVAHSKGPAMWKEMLDLLGMHEGHSDAPWTVVHSASSVTTLSPAFLELTVRLHPEELRQKDKYGRLPLHVVSSLDPIPFSFDEEEDDRELKINTILHGFPSAARVRDNSDSLPLHKAIVAGQSWSSLSCLVRAAPATLCRRDGVHKLYPFQLAACSEAAGLSELYQLLVSAPHILSQQSR